MAMIVQNALEFPTSVGDDMSLIPLRMKNAKMLQHNFYVRIMTADSYDHSSATDDIKSPRLSIMCGRESDCNGRVNIR